MISKLPYVVAVFTGGTISMKVDSVSGGAVPCLSGSEILASVPEVQSVAELEAIDFARYPGPHMTPELMLRLSQQVDARLSEESVQGALITHGTDTMEETAYLLSLTLRSRKPVVFVGAMRNASQPGWDGPSNLLSAVRVAASSRTRSLGVVICMNDTIVPADDATKTHTVALDAFQGRDAGVLGRIEGTDIILFRRAGVGEKLNTGRLKENVEIIKLAAGSSGKLIELAVESGVKGLVIEGLGCGNVPITALRQVEGAIAKSIPVVIATRCHRGPTSTAYAYEGAAKRLEQAGAILAGFLPSHKARIKLMVLLGSNASMSTIRASFKRTTGDELGDNLQRPR